MDRRKFYGILFILVLGAGFLATAVFPFYKPLSLMFYFDRQYSESLERYQVLYDRHDRSISVVGPLILLNLEYANVHEALRLLEEYVANNPSSRDAWEYLGELYLGADRPHSYIKTVNESYKLVPSQNKLREMIKYYSYWGDIDKKIWAYEELVKHFNPDGWEVSELGLLYAAKGDRQKAISIVDKGLQVCIDVAACNFLADLYVSLLIDEKETDRALQFAIEYLNHRPNSTVARDLAMIFNQKNQPKEALALLGSLPSSIELSSDLVEARVTALNLEGDETGVYSYLKGLLGENKLPSKQLDSLITLGLQFEDDPRKFENVIKGENLSTLTDSSLQALIKVAYQERLPLLREKLAREIPKEALADNVLLRYSFELTAKPTITPDDLVFYLRPNEEELVPEERVELAFLYNMVHLNALAKEELLSLESWDALPNKQLVPLTYLYLQFGLSDKGFTLADDLRHRMANPPMELDVAWLLLATAVHQEALVNEWLAKKSHTLEPVYIKDVYLVAIQEKIPSIALQTAKILKQRNPSDNAERMYADALILDGQNEEGLAILEALYEKRATPPVIVSYVSALAKNPEKEALLHTVLDKELKNQDLKDADLRNIGYALSEADLKKEAIPIFLRLAKDRPFDDPDTQTLLGLFGEHPTSEEVAWVRGKVFLAKKEERAPWFDYLNSTGNAQSVYELIEEGDIENLDIAEVYFSTLASLHKKDELTGLLGTILPSLDDLEKLKKLGRIANGEGFNDAGEAIYLKILSEHPLDEEALKELGIIYYAKAAFRYSKWYLGLLLTHYKGEYLSHYYYAQMFYRNAHYREARPYYLKALEEIGVPNEKDTYAQIVQAEIYNRLNYPRTAILIYYDLLERFPYDPNIRADFGALLIDLNCLNEASCVLFDIPENPSEKETRKDANGYVHLENVRTLWYNQAGRMQDAFCNAENTLQNYPKEGSAYAALAGLKGSIGLYRQAIDDYVDARIIEPDNEDFYRAEMDIHDAHLPYGFGEFEYRKTGSTQKEHFLRLGFAYNLKEHSQLQMLVEQDDIEVKNYTRPQDGVLVPDFKGFRYRGALGWVYDSYTGLRTRIDAFFSKHVFGAGVYASQIDLYGATGAGFEYRRPNWDYVETTIDYGSRDRVFLDRVFRYDDRISLDLLAALNRYYLEDVPKSAAESVSWQGALIYRVPDISCLKRALGNDSSLYLSYSVDAEYPTWVYTRKDLLGICYTPLPITNRETQMAEVSVQKSVCRYWKIHANLGYAYDRYGTVNKAVPVYGAEVNWDKRPGLTFRMLYDHSPSTSTVGQNVDRFLLNLTYFY